MIVATGISSFSLLAQLPVEFLLISAGHPFPIVLMNRCATNLAGTLFRVCFGLVDAFAMPQACGGIHSENSKGSKWNG